MLNSWKWYFVLLQCCCHLSFGQRNRIPFEHIGTKEGLSQSNILSIVQDSRGFMWFGSWDGLNKYDGYKMTVYKNSTGDINSLSNNYINSISENKNDNLWIATANGLNYFDRKTELFTRYMHHTDNSNSIRCNNINKVMVDRQGMVWVCTAEGLDRFNTVTNRFEHIAIPGIEKNGAVSNAGIKSIFEDSKGNLWVSVINEGISLYNRQNRTFSHFLHDEKNSRSLSSNTINEVFEDSRHHIWLATNGGGLDMLDEKQQGFLHFKHDDNNRNSLEKNVVLAINEDTENNLWVSTENGGISLFNYSTGSFSTYQHDEIDKESISNNSIYCIYRDNKGNMWLGNFAGWVDMAMHDKLLFTHYKHMMSSNSLCNNQVLSIMEDSKNQLWIGTDGGGLDIFDPQTNGFTHYRYNKKNPNSISSDNVLCTMEDSKGNTWIGTWIGGITVMNRQKKVTGYFKHDPSNAGSLANNNAWKIFEDSHKRIWIGTYGGGLDLLNADGKTFTHYRNNPANGNSIAAENIINIYEDSEGYLWLSSESKGLDRFDTHTQQFTHFVHDDSKNSISNTYVNSVIERNDGNLWIGTMNGLNCYNKKSGQFRVFTTADGLAGDYVFGVLEDDSNNLWISTNRGISCLHLNTGRFENFGITEGLQSDEFKQLAFCKTRSGMMYFGGINGFNQFFPGSIRKTSYDPPLVVTNFTIFNKQVPIQVSDGEASPLKQSITETKCITLPYSSSVFSLEFASLNYTDNAKKKYTYMLEGFDQTWNEAGTARSATYTNLDPGTYIFKIRGIDNQDNMSAKTTMMTIVIKPPFWLTWWFKLALCVAVTGAVIGIYRVRISVSNNQKLKLQQQVNEQTSLLKHSVTQERIARKVAEKAHRAATVANAELEESEKRYSSLFYESPQPMWVYDIDSLKFSKANKAAVKLYGFSEEELLGMSILDLSPQQEQQRMLQALSNECKKAGTTYNNGRFRHITRSGEMLDVEIYCNSIKINDREYRLIIAVDITEKMRVENKITKAIIKTQEDERYEIGGELHDNVCQILASSQMNISMLNNSLPESMRPFYDQGKQSIKLALDEIRNLSHRLAPAFFDEMTLEEAFKMLTASVNAGDKYTISLYFYKSLNSAILPRDLQLNLYRILQEQLRNIVKYSNATYICIDLMINNKKELIMQTSDDGVGFDITASRGGIGLANMKRRAELFCGAIKIDSSPGNGCSITVKIPLSDIAVLKN